MGEDEGGRGEEGIEGEGAESLGGRGGGRPLVGRLLRCRGGGEWEEGGGEFEEGGGDESLTTSPLSVLLCLGDFLEGRRGRTGGAGLERSGWPTSQEEPRGGRGGPCGEQTLSPPLGSHT